MILCRKDCLPLTIKVSGRQILARKAQFRASSCRPLVLYLRRNINEDKSTHPNDRTVVWSSTSPLWRSGLRKRTRELKDQSLSTLRKMLVSLVRRRECFTFTGLSILLAYDILYLHQSCVPPGLPEVAVQGEYLVILVHRAHRPDGQVHIDLQHRPCWDSGPGFESGTS